MLGWIIVLHWCWECQHIFSSNSHETCQYYREWPADYLSLRFNKEIDRKVEGQGTDIRAVRNRMFERS